MTYKSNKNLQLLRKITYGIKRQQGIFQNNWNYLVATYVNKYSKFIKVWFSTLDFKKLIIVKNIQSLLNMRSN